MFFKIFEKKISFLNKYQKVLLIKNNKKNNVIKYSKRKLQNFYKKCHKNLKYFLQYLQKKNFFINLQLNICYQDTKILLTKK